MVNRCHPDFFALLDIDAFVGSIKKGNRKSEILMRDLEVLVPPLC